MSKVPVKVMMTVYRKDLLLPALQLAFPPIIQLVKSMSQGGE
jgi:hypothetical protein